jgi:uncharacterized membrane protein YraQ (UPF0718 family)
MENKTDPICGMKGTIKAHNHYFCSEFCIRKYEEQQGIEKEKCYVCAVPAKKWYKEKIFLVFFGIIIVILAHFILQSLGIKLLRDFVHSFYDYVKLIWLALIIGFLLGGAIDYFVPRKYVSKYLSQHKKRTIFYSVGLGFLMSACSHGILAIAIELYKKGASTPAVIAFLLASPWANLPITIILFGFFGIKAFLFVGSAIVIAIITGLIFQVLDKKGLIEPGKHTVEVEEDFSIRKDIKRRWQEYHFSLKNLKNEIFGVLRGSWELSKMVLWWILIGMFLASAARAYVPHNFFMNYMGPTLLGLLVTLVLATIIEVCSEGTAPLAFEIFKQTNAFGNSFVFLMAGVATDYTEIGLIWSNIGKKTAIWLPIVTVPQIILLGYIFNSIL